MILLESLQALEAIANPGVPEKVFRNVPLFKQLQSYDGKNVDGLKECVTNFIITENAQYLLIICPLELLPTYQRFMNSDIV